MVKLYEAGSRLSNFPGEAGKCRGNFLHMNRPLLHALDTETPRTTRLCNQSSNSRLTAKVPVSALFLELNDNTTL